MERGGRFEIGSIRLENISKVFVDEDGEEVLALKNVSFEVNDGEFVCIVGPSGCGKTTLLRIAAGLEKPTAGKVYLDGKEVKGPGSERGMVFQEYALFPWRTVKKNIEFGLELKNVPKKEREEIIKRYVDLVGLNGFESSYPHELSGGMKQRVALARVLANDPDVLLMDEPFGALDAQTRNVMQEELLRVWQKARKTVLFVTHSVDEAVYLGDKVVVLTARPGEVKGIFEINVPRPRNRTACEPIVLTRAKILDILTEEVKKTLI
ncbi:MAG: ABC transporter ATP-binding protein [Candidatus Hydrothermarchaeota archaeon]